MADPVSRRDLFRKLAGQAEPEEEEPKVFAHLATEHCIAYLGPECGACADLCPEGVDALKLVLARPIISAQQCTGCGDCVHACPTSPRALELVKWVG